MAVPSFFAKLINTIQEWFDALRGKPKPEHPLIRYGTPIAFTLLAIVALCAAYFSYRWYVNIQEQAAQYACSQLIDEYMELQKQESPDYGPLIEKCAAAYERYKRSSVAPYIVSFQVDALLKAKRHEDAVTVMDRLVMNLPNDMNTTALFKTKHALLLLDSENEPQKEDGLKLLTVLADDLDNPHRDYALYHLGLYYWTRNELVQARTAWQELTEAQEVELQAPSPWVEVVAEKLATIPA
jgi:predicted negative regulator of RcsB-dependent stress response